MSDNNNYLKKYLKYKIKYLELLSIKDTKILEGGKIKKNISKRAKKKIEDLKHDDNFCGVIEGLLISLENIIKNNPNDKYNQETIDIILDVFIKQKTLLLNLYNNKECKYLIIPLVLNLLQLKTHKKEIKIILKDIKNIKIIKYLNEYDINVKTIIDYLKSI